MDFGQIDADKLANINADGQLPVFFKASGDGVITNDPGGKVSGVNNMNVNAFLSVGAGTLRGVLEKTATNGGFQELRGGM